MSWFQKTKPPETHESRHALAMVLLSDTAAPDLRAAIMRVAPQADVSVDATGSILTASALGATIALAHMAVPIPSSDLDAPAALAWHWPDAREAVGSHSSHVVVHASSSELDPIDLHLLHARVVAAVVECSAGIAVYVGHASLLRSGSAYLAETEGATRDALPLMLWVGFNPVDDVNGVTAYTTGLTEFGFLELETRSGKRGIPAIPELLGVLADVATYQLATGNVLDHDDTLRLSNGETYLVRHVPSRFIPDVTIALVQNA